MYIGDTVILATIIKFRRLISISFGGDTGIKACTRVGVVGDVITCCVVIAVALSIIYSMGSRVGKRVRAVVSYVICY